MSKKHDPQLFLEDILESISHIESYAQDIDLSVFINDIMLQDAIIRRIEIIGEAVGRLPEVLKEQHPEVPWQDIKDMRNKLIHDYGHVDLELVWVVVQKEIPKLKSIIRKVMNNF